MASQLAQNIRRTFDLGLLNVCNNKTFGECFPKAREKHKRLLMFCERQENIVSSEFLNVYAIITDNKIQSYIRTK